MASSFSEGERVRLFTLSLPESFQFFSMSERAAIGSYYSTVAPGTFLPQAFHGLRCLTWGQKAKYSRVRARVHRRNFRLPETYRSHDFASQKGCQMSEAPEDLHHRLDQLRLLASETDDPWLRGSFGT